MLFFVYYYIYTLNAILFYLLTCAFASRSTIITCFEEYFRYYREILGFRKENNREFFRACKLLRFSFDDRQEIFLYLIE